MDEQRAVWIRLKSAKSSRLLNATVNRGPKWLLVSGLAALAILVAMVQVSPPYGVFDEPFYLRYTQLLDRFGLSQSFLLNLPGSPGPLVSFVQYSFKPLTHFEFPQMRWANLVVLGGLLVVLAQALRRFGPDSQALFSMMALAIPVTWQMSGLVLSDLPAVFFLSASVVMILDWCSTAEKATGRLFGMAALGGFLLGVAGLGRQTALACAAIPLCIALYQRWRFPSALVFAAAALLVVAPVFIVWGGILPPSPLHVSPGLAPKHLLLSFAYGALFMLILAPGFFRVNMWLNILILLVGIVLNLLWRLIDFAPLESVARSLGPVGYMVFRRLASGVLMGVAAVFAFNLIQHAWRFRRDVHYVTCTMGCLLITLTPLAISSNYASRYTALGLPFFILLGSRFSATDVWAAGRLIIGGGIGALSLRSYYSQSPWTLPWEEVIRFGP